MDKDKIFGPLITVVAAVAAILLYPLVRGWAPSTVDDRVLAPALVAALVLLLTLAWQVWSYARLRYFGAGPMVLGHFLSYNALEEEIGLFSISVNKKGAGYCLKGSQYSIKKGHLVGGWNSSAPLAVESIEGAPRVSYMYVGFNKSSRERDSTRGYASIQFFGDRFERGTGIYIDATRTDLPPRSDAPSTFATAQINHSTYWKLDDELLRKIAIKSTAAAVRREPKVLLENLALKGQTEIEQWLDGDG